MTATAAQTITVGPGSTYKTIQSAVDAASPGDTIAVESGTYSENVLVTKSLTIVAANGAAPVLNAGSSTHGFWVAANNVIIQGFTVKGTGGWGKWCSGFYVTGNNALILNNKVDGFRQGIHLIPGSGSIVNGNTVTNCLTGIRLYNTANSVVTRSSVSGSNFGLQVDGSSGSNTIYLNTFTGGSSVSGASNRYNSATQMTYTYHGKTFSGYIGNRWVSYKGTDSDGNGVGSTAYKASGITDSYPLMEPQTSFLLGGAATPTATPAPTATPTARPTVTPAPTATPSPTATPTPTQPYSGKYVGFAATRMGVSSFPSADYWAGFDNTQAAKFSGAGMDTIWIIGGVEQGGVCYLNFPSSTSYPNMRFAATDENEAYLSYFDTHNIKVYLQVEPGLADMDTVLKLVLDRYSKHPSVIGVGIDAEWIQAPTYSGGKPITDAEAAHWVSVVQSYNPGYTVALTHWVTGNMPPTYRTGLYFLYDGQGASSLADLTNYYAKWAQTYSGYPAGIYIGYPVDKTWWSTYSDPYYSQAQYIFKNVPNTKGVYWVSYNIQDIYTGTPAPAPTATPTPQPTVTPVPTATPTVTPSPTQPYSGKYVGFSATRLGVSSFPSADYWAGFDNTQAAKFSGAGMDTIWIIGGVEQGGVCYLNFPSSTSYSNVRFAATDENEAYLSYFDTHNIKVYLQVEPGLADIDTVLKLVLDRYSKHPSVIGVGIDAEWIQAPTYSGGKPITDAEAAHWVGVIQSYNPNYQLALTHWVTGNMPPTYRKDLYFLYDGQGASSLADLTNYYAKWAQTYSGYPAGIYIGYPVDKTWWSTYSDPYYSQAQYIFKNVPNTKGVYWVNYNIQDIYSG